MSLRGPVPTLTPEARRAEFSGWDGWDGMDGMDGMGWDGRTEYQKCPLIFFMLCEYIAHVYTGSWSVSESTWITQNPRGFS